MENTLDAKIGILGKVMNRHSLCWLFLSNFGLQNKLYANGPNRQESDFA